MNAIEKPKVSVVIPVYRSQETLHELCERIRDVFDKTLQQSFEVILVDDASPDGSWDQLCKIHGEDPRFKAVQLIRNFGQHRALMCGFGLAAGEYIITMDDDLQHPPEEIPKLVAALEENPYVDLAIGAYTEKKHSFFRNIGTAVSRKLGLYIFKLNLDLHFTSFQIVRAHTAKAILDIRIERPWVGQLLIQMSNKVINVPVNHDFRKYGDSGYTYWQLTKVLLSNVINNSSLPLQLISLFGSFSAVMSFFLAGYYVYRYFFVGISVAGWTTLILLLLFYFGVLLLAIGIIGEYLIRILKENKRMPQYVVRRQLR